MMLAIEKLMVIALLLMATKMVLVRAKPGIDKNENYKRRELKKMAVLVIVMMIMML